MAIKKEVLDELFAGAEGREEFHIVDDVEFPDNISGCRDRSDNQGIGSCKGVRVGGVVDVLQFVDLFLAAMPRPVIRSADRQKVTTRASRFHLNPYPAAAK